MIVSVGVFVRSRLSTLCSAALCSLIRDANRAAYFLDPVVHRAAKQHLH